MKKVLLIAALVIFIPVLLVAILYLVSPLIGQSKKGEKLSKALDIPYPAVVAHRGASYLAPESTLPAYMMARELGADYLEADLQRTADGVIIAFHDDTPERTTNVAEVFPGRESDYIETFTYAELMELDTGSWFNEAFPERARDSFAGLKILTLDELITIAEEGNNNPGLYLETKSAERHPGMEEEIVGILRERGWLDGAPSLPGPDPARNVSGAPVVHTAASPARVIFQSFSRDSIARLSTLAPEFPGVLLVGMDAEGGWRDQVEFAAKNGGGIGPVGFIAWPWNIGAAHRAGLVVHVYTINPSWQMKLVSRFGADGIFTDLSEVALEVYGKGGPFDLEAVFERIGY